LFDGSAGSAAIDGKPRGSCAATKGSRKSRARE
jgi:hypothetical protein